MAAQDPDTSVLLTYAVTIGGPMILSLVAVIWKMVRDEARATTDALAQKASAEALKEVKEMFQQRLKEVQERQDREIDWIKAEMDKIARSLDEMRRENNSANSMILQRLQDLALSVGNARATA